MGRRTWSSKDELDFQELSTQRDVLTNEAVSAVVNLADRLDAATSRECAMVLCELADAVIDALKPFSVREAQRLATKDLVSAAQAGKPFNRIKFFSDPSTGKVVRFFLDKTLVAEFFDPVFEDRWEVPVHGSAILDTSRVM